MSQTASIELPTQTYDPSKVGRIIGAGGDHLVREYTHNRVIKYSLLFVLLGNDALGKARRDIALGERFFGEYFLPTEVAMSPNGRFVVHIQPKIRGRYLYSSDMRKAFIRKQFEDIRRGYDALEAAGHPDIDLVGRQGFFSVRPCLSNIFVDTERRLHIIDGTFLKIDGLLGHLLSPIQTLVFFRQRSILKAFEKCS